MPLPRFLPGILAVVLLAAPALAPAQRPALTVQLPPRAIAANEGPMISSRGILEDRELRDLLRHGFPARLHYRVELWSAEGWFDDLERTTEWDVIVRYDPLEKKYRAARIDIEGDRERITPLGEFVQLVEVAAAVERPVRAPIEPRRRGRRHYYNVLLAIETLSYNDLDEVERWLRGELRPAVRGKRNPGTAVGRGVQTLVVRLLGGKRREYRARSPTFRP